MPLVVSSLLMVKTMLNDTSRIDRRIFDFHTLFISLLLNYSNKKEFFVSLLSLIALTYNLDTFPSAFSSFLQP